MLSESIWYFWGAAAVWIIATAIIYWFSKKCRTGTTLLILFGSGATAILATIGAAWYTLLAVIVNLNSQYQDAWSWFTVSIGFASIFVAITVIDIICTKTQGFLRLRALFSKHVLLPIYEVSERWGLRSLHPLVKAAATILFVSFLSRAIGLYNTIITMPLWLGLIYLVFAPYNKRKGKYCIPILNLLRAPPLRMIIIVFFLAEAPYIGTYLRMLEENGPH